MPEEHDEPEEPTPADITQRPAESEYAKTAAMLKELADAGIASAFIRGPEYANLTKRFEDSERKLDESSARMTDIWRSEIDRKIALEQATLNTSDRLDELSKTQQTALAEARSSSRTSLGLNIAIAIIAVLTLLAAAATLYLTATRPGP
jgi:predicted transcriptional regulator